MTTHLKNEKSELVGCFSVDLTSATIGRGDCDENNGREKRDSCHVFFFRREGNRGGERRRGNIIVFGGFPTYVLYCVVPVCAHDGRPTRVRVFGGKRLFDEKSGDVVLTSGGGGGGRRQARDGGRLLDGEVKGSSRGLRSISSLCRRPRIGGSRG